MKNIFKVLAITFAALIGFSFFACNGVDDGTSGTAPTITTTSLPSGTVGTPYSQTLAATGTTPITWSVESGALPAGLDIAATGVISGTPTTADTFTFTVKATNATKSDTKQLSIVIATSVNNTGKTEVNLAAPTLTISGVSAHWTAVTNANEDNGYTIKINTTEHIVTVTSYDLSTLDVGNYQISVKTNGYETETHIYKASNYSDEKPYNVKTVPVKYTITYTNTYDLDNNNPTEYTEASETITFAALTGTRTGYTFSGWTPASIPTGSTGNQTITAQWTPITYYIQYNANGGTGSMSNSTHTYGTAQALTANAFTRTDYIFAGWTTNADGTGTSYTNSQSVLNLTTTAGTTINLYAKWVSGNVVYCGSFLPTGSQPGVPTSPFPAFNATDLIDAIEANNITPPPYVAGPPSTAAALSCLYTKTATGTQQFDVTIYGYIFIVIPKTSTVSKIENALHLDTTASWTTPTVVGDYKVFNMPDSYRDSSVTYYVQF